MLMNIYSQIILNPLFKTMQFVFVDVIEFMRLKLFYYSFLSTIIYSVVEN